MANLKYKQHTQYVCCNAPCIRVRTCTPTLPPRLPASLPVLGPDLALCGAAPRPCVFASVASTRSHVCRCARKDFCVEARDHHRRVTVQALSRPLSRLNSAQRSASSTNHTRPPYVCPFRPSFDLPGGTCNARVGANPRGPTQEQRASWRGCGKHEP